MLSPQSLPILERLCDTPLKRAARTPEALKIIKNKPAYFHQANRSRSEKTPVTEKSPQDRLLGWSQTAEKETQRVLGISWVGQELPLGLVRRTPSDCQMVHFAGSEHSMRSHRGPGGGPHFTDAQSGAVWASQTGVGSGGLGVWWDMAWHCPKLQ